MLEAVLAVAAEERLQTAGAVLGAVAEAAVPLTLVDHEVSVLLMYRCRGSITAGLLLLRVSTLLVLVLWVGHVIRL